MNSAFVGFEGLSKSRRVLSTEAENTLLNLQILLSLIHQLLINQYHRHQYPQALAQEMSEHQAIVIHLKPWTQVLHSGAFSGM